jgi:hypothetical protein
LRFGYAPRMTRLAPILVSLLAIAVASCGGDDAPTEDEFADRANQICREAEQSLKDVGEGAQSPEDIVNAIDRVIEETRDTVDELADLERPEGDAGETAQEFVDATRSEIEDEGIPALEDLRQALQDRDQDAAQEAAARLQEISSTRSDEAAREIGATACAEDGQ